MWLWQSTLKRWFLRTAPLATRSVIVTSPPPGYSSARRARLTTWYSTRNGFLNPRSFGARMWNGSWPPSNPGRMLPRALEPLVPRPAVFPFEPSPRPTRVLSVFAPGAGRKWCTLRTGSRWAISAVAFFAAGVARFEGVSVVVAVAVSATAKVETSAGEATFGVFLASDAAWGSFPAASVLGVFTAPALGAFSVSTLGAFPAVSALEAFPASTLGAFPPVSPLETFPASTLGAFPPVSALGAFTAAGFSVGAPSPVSAAVVRVFGAAAAAFFSSAISQSPQPSPGGRRC